MNFFFFIPKRRLQKRNTYKCATWRRAHRNVDKHFDDFSSGEEFLQGIQEILVKETVGWELNNVLSADAVNETAGA